MRIDIAAGNHRYNPYSPFKTDYERQLLERYKQGWVVHLWRGTSPWNLFLRDPTNSPHSHDMMIRGKDDEAIRDECNLHMGHFVRIGKRLATQDGLIAMALSAREVGQPLRECYAFDPAKAERVEREWAEVEQALALRKTWPVDTSVRDFRELSKPAISVLRLFYNVEATQSYAYDYLYPHPELAPMLQELEEFGAIELVAYRDTVGFKLRPQYAGEGPGRLARRAELRLIGSGSAVAG